METIAGANNWKLVIRREGDGITLLQAVTCDLRHKDALESGVAGGKGAPSVKTPGIKASHLGDKPGALTG